MASAHFPHWGVWPTQEDGQRQQKTVSPHNLSHYSFEGLSASAPPPPPSHWQKIAGWQSVISVRLQLQMSWRIPLWFIFLNDLSPVFTSWNRFNHFRGVKDPTVSVGSCADSCRRLIRPKRQLITPVKSHECVRACVCMCVHKSAHECNPLKPSVFLAPWCSAEKTTHSMMPVSSSPSSSSSPF